MTYIFTNIARMRNERWLNWQGEILIDEYGKDNTMVGRNYAYKPVIVKENHRLGDKVNVKRKGVVIWEGEILSKKLTRCVVKMKGTGTEYNVPANMLTKIEK